MEGVTFISSLTLIPKISRDFGLEPSDWVGDFKEYVQEALEYIQCGAGLVLRTTPAYVINFKVVPKCKLEFILAIEYKGKRLRKSDGLNAADTEFLKGLPSDIYNFYVPEYPGIRTSFSEGEIKIHHLAYTCDEEGGPMIPDRIKTKEAITWYCLMKLISRGYTHPIFEYEAAESRWEAKYKAAQNDLKMQSLDKAAAFKKIRMQLIPNINREDSLFSNPE